MSLVNYNLLSKINENVSRETFEALEQFSELLLKWNTKINLVSKRITSDELWSRHILDSAQLINHLPKKSRIIDLGSGAGFPGIILSIISDFDITLVESDQRKCAFMHEVAIKFNLKLNIINKRIEDIDALPCDVIISRALASLDKLLEYSEKLLQKDTFMLLLKGQNLVEEIKDASISWCFNSEIFEDAFSSEGKIVKISNIRRL